MHFMIERLLDGGISNEDEVTEFEVVLDNGGCMLLFETDRGLDSCGVHIGGETDVSGGQLCAEQ